MATDQIFNEGYFLKDVSEGSINNLATFSLQNALLSYVKTADDLDYLYSNEDLLSSSTQLKRDQYHGIGYAVDACNAIVQFQHFLELFLKDVLLTISPLMVYDPTQRTLLLLKMIKSDPITDTELEGVHFIEFSEALKRTEALLRNGTLNPCYNFLINYLDTMKQINTLRNRIAHRGAFIVRHDALDSIFGKHILPFVKELEDNLSDYNNILSRRMNIKDTTIKPFELIINEYKTSSPNEYAVYVYKMMALAGFNNKLEYHLAEYFQDYLDGKIKDAESIANIIAENQMYDIMKCPICECNTLIECTETETIEDDYGNIEDMWTYVYRIECQQCGFHLNHWLENKIKGVSLPIPNYF